jgi:hypothetical protein
MVGPPNKIVTIKATDRAAWVTECVSDPAMNFADEIADKLSGTGRDKTGLQIQTACPRIYWRVRRQIWRDSWGCWVLSPSFDPARKEDLNPSLLQRGSLESHRDNFFSFPAYPLTPTTVGSNVREADWKAELLHGVRPHLLRRSRITHLVGII